MSFKYIVNVTFLILVTFIFLSCSQNNKSLNDELTIRVMSYNIHYGNGMDGIYSLENIANVINKSEADVVGLQEIGDSIMAEKLGELTNMKVVFGPSLGSSSGYGDAILSKYPFTFIGNLAIPSASSSRYQAMAVDVDFSSKSKGLGKVRVINTHFDWLSTIGSEHARLSSIDVIEEAFFSERDNLPAILTADLNSTPDSDVLLKMNKFGWINYIDGNTHFTHSSTNPEMQIDYVLYRSKSEWTVKDMFAMYGEESSDHLPIVMDIALQP